MSKYYRVRKIKERGYNEAFYVESCKSLLDKIRGIWTRHKRGSNSFELAIDYITDLKKLDIMEDVIVYYHKAN